jgi:HEAT repeat protein
MRNRIIRHFVALCLLGLIFPCNSALSSTASQKSDAADVPRLIDELGDKDEQTAMKAALALLKLGAGVIPALRESLKQRKGCQFQFVASGVIFQIDHDEGFANPILTDVALGRCEGTSKNDLAVRRQAAFSLVVRAAGIPAVAQMLKDKDTLIRRSAAFAFDDLTERMEDGRPDSIKVTPEIVGATKDALPLLVQALDDKDEVVRCMSYESLEQAQGSSHEEVRAEARRLMQGVKVRCSK